MKISQIRWHESSGWEAGDPAMQQCQLVLAFSAAGYMRDPACYEALRERFPEAQIVGCSSSGSVMGVELSDDDVVATAVQLERGRIRLAVRQLDQQSQATEVGEALMRELEAPDLRHVFVLSDGLHINGSDLASGLNRAGIAVTGGLAGDGTDFAHTAVMANAAAAEWVVAAIGFYGDIQVGSGCFAGWDEFGAERIVTRASGNTVYEIDGEPALTLYKRYLGEAADELPYSGLRFPISIQASRTDEALIRTLLSVNEEESSLVFAGDVPQGHICKLMQGNIDKLIESAGLAAEASAGGSGAGLCLVVSCVGRRLVMGQLVEDELEIVQQTLGDNTAITGFYSYGELAPFSGLMQCELHNQTMTLTTIYE